MTTNPRPNLGGLFTGSTPPDRSSTVVAALGPRLVVTAPQAVEPAAAESRVKATEPEPAPAVDGPPPPRASRPTPRPSAPVPPLGAPPAQSGLVAALELIDPLRAVERYFGLLQAVLDVNRRIAIAVTSTALSLPRRAGIWR